MLERARALEMIRAGFFRSQILKLLQPFEFSFSICKMGMRIPTSQG